MDRTMRLEVPYDGIRQVAYGPCTIAEYKGIEYLAENHVTQKETAYMSLSGCSSRN